MIVRLVLALMMAPWYGLLAVLATLPLMIVTVALVWVFVPGGVQDDRPGRDMLRVKGMAVRFDVLRIQGDRAALLGSGDRLAPGSRLGFRVHCPAGCWAWRLCLWCYRSCCRRL